MLSDCRYAFRSFLRTPGFSIVAIITLALGIGGATAIFSVVDGILLRPLPYPSPERLVQVRRLAGGVEDAAVSAADYLDIKRDTRGFAHLAGYREDVIDLTGMGDPIRVTGVQTTAGFFDVFGADLVIGRTYSESADPPGASLAVVSEGFWRRQFGARREAIGRTVRANGQSLEIVGVVRETFRHPVAADIWTLSPRDVPISPIATDTGGTREVRYFSVVGRLAPAAALHEVGAEIDALAARLARELPDTNADETFVVRPLAETLVADDARAGLLVLLGAVISVLLIASANVAALMLARGSARRRELAIRASLGAGRARLVRLLLSESLIIAFAGGLVGFVLAAWMQDALVSLAPDTIPRLGDVRLDARVGLMAFAVTALIGVLAGLAPAAQSGHTPFADDLRPGGRATSSRTRLRSALVVGEVAVALVLLVSAGLLLSSLLKLAHVDPGFSTTSLVAVELPVPQARYDVNGQRVFYGEVLARLQADPVTARSAIVFPIPLRGSSASGAFAIEGQPAGPRATRKIAEINGVSAEYFQTAGLRLVRGRTFNANDAEGAPAVGVVNERLAAEWGGVDPIGRRINLGSWVTVVGVVSDARRQSLDVPPAPAVYLPYQQFTLPFMGVMVRTDRPLSAVANSARAAVRGVDAELPVGDVLTIEQIIEASTGQPRFRTVIVLAFAAVAVVLALVGVYGLVSYSVTQRTNEMGLRIALGASPWRVCGLVLRQGVGLALAGVIAGSAAALAVTRAIAGLLFETSPSDPLIHASLAILLMTVTALACYVPARRAMRVDPMTALRAD
jgi:putative ABC transport system permease protein